MESIAGGRILKNNVEDSSKEKSGIERARAQSWKRKARAAKEISNTSSGSGDVRKQKLNSNEGHGERYEDQRAQEADGKRAKAKFSQLGTQSNLETAVDESQPHRVP
ncbi:hypothetical protein U1Q18_001340 [Sarracenia purpurea var. burkii]